MEQGPLSDPQLSEIEAKLDAGHFDEAQRLLAELGALPGNESVSAYFVTRLLFQRGKLDRAGVIERLRDLLAQAPYFPEAQRMLDAAESGILDRSTKGFKRTTRAPSADATETDFDLIRSAPDDDELSHAGTGASENEIPRAPLLPHFADLPRPGPARSLTPPELELPRPGPARSLTPPELELPRAGTARSLTPPRIELSQPGPARSLTPPEIPSLEIPATRANPSTPSLFEIAAALDAGHPARALELCESATQAGPELTLLTARSLVGLDRKDQALSHLERLLRAPLIEPLVRSASARLLIDLGRPEQALDQARRAVADDPEDPVARVTCAWALLRLLLRTGDAGVAKEADLLLAATRVREGALLPLFSALRALSMAERGDPARALDLSQTALQLDPRQLDAISAIAIASARLGLHSDAERAQRRLFELNPEQARATESALLRHGLRPARAELAARASQSKVSSLWGEIEAGFVQGRREPAVQAFESACVDRFRPLARRGHADAWFDLGSVAARLFNELPVLRHFAPYDRSVFSVERLDTALRVLYGKNARHHAEEPVLALLGAYVGESWRQAFGGEWHGVPVFPFSASVEATGMSVRPCERVLARLRDGSPLDFDAPPSLHPGADPLGNSVPLSLAPPSPWDPDPWPSLTRLAEIGRLLPESVVGYYCASELAVPLDHSVSSSVAIDRYVALLAPAKAPPDPDAAWARRAAVLLGAYLGEVLVDALGARWESAEEARGPDRYRVLFVDGSSSAPVARVLDRLAGRGPSLLADYVSRLASGPASRGA